MSTDEGTRRYRYLDAVLVRAPASPNVSGPSVWPALGGEADVEQWCAWLVEVWAQAEVSEAVTIASPVLAERVLEVCQGHRPAADRVRRMVLSLARYLVRMRGRATPFALFAGIASVRFGPDASALWTGRRHVRARADAVWLAEMIFRLESCVELRRRLSLVMNDLAFVRGDRLVVPWHPHAGDPGRSSTSEVSVRRNRAVQAVMEAASSPIQGGELIEKLSAEFLDPVAALERVLTELIACGALITSLRPPSTSADGLMHVLDELGRVGAFTVEEAAPLVQALAQIRADLDTVSGTVVSSDRLMTADRMRALSNSAELPLMLDLRLGGTLTLPPEVAAEAVHAAGALLRLTPHSDGHPGWQDYHSRFLARYGTGALVPVQQLVDITTGLGYPAHYTKPSHEAFHTGMPRRYELLLALAQQAVLDGVPEAVVDENFLDALMPGDVGELRHAPHMAVCAEVHAPTMAALAAGDFTLALTGVGRTGVALTGRFIDLLSEEDRQRMTGLFDELPVGVDGAISAQLSFPPRHPRIENVACSPRLLPGLLSVAEYRDGAPDRLPIRDLAVTTDLSQLYLVSLSQRRVVEPTLTNAAAPHTMPPIARFLFEIPRARRAAVSAFSWGPGECLPFLPRLRHGRTVLTPARWRIPAGALPGPEAPSPMWQAAMDVLRERLRLPDNVSVGHGDRLLRLSLDEPMDLTLLREHLDKAGRDAAVTEAPSASDLGWFAGRAHEVVVPLAATTPPAPAPAVLNISGPLPVISPENGLLPGSQVLFAKVYGHPDVFDTILTEFLPDLWSAWPDPPTWWFVRYQDPRPHLRLRLHLATSQDYGSAAARVGAWAADLRRRGLAGDLALDTYHPEIARYGSGPALMAAEALFAADSTAVLAQLEARAAVRDVHPDVLTVASMVDFTCGLTGSVRAGMRWLIEHIEIGPTPAPDRAIVRQAISLADPDDQVALNALASGPLIAVAWQARHEAATTYVEHLASDADHVRRVSAFSSLLHMHHIRAHGIEPAAEELCHRVARSVAPVLDRPSPCDRGNLPMTHYTDLLAPRQIRDAQTVAARLADALATPAVVQRRDDSPRWFGQSLSKGAAGVAVLHGARAHAGVDSWERVHQWLTCATRRDLSAGSGAGLWHGAPAIAFALSTATPPGPYARAREQLGTTVTTLVRSRLDAAMARLDAAQRPSPAEFDLVRGLTGLGAHLLQRDPHDPLVRQVLAYLVRLTEPVPANDSAGMAAPGWWTGAVPLGRPVDVFRDGHADLGIAHGITGPLALLALAMRRGITVDGQAAAIDIICRWLDAWRQDGPVSPWWPKRVTLAELRAGRSTRCVPGRPSWCYSTPGIARAQQLAGIATGDLTRQQQAENDLNECLSDPGQPAQLTDLTLCHGWSGLIATSWYAAADALTPDLSTHLPRLLDTFLDKATNGESPTLKLPGLIDGSAGIALTLHTITTGTSVGWETCLLIN